MKRYAIGLLATMLTAVGAEPSLKIALYEQSVLCVQVSQWPADFGREFQALQPTNRLTGVVLDLRFTSAASGFAPVDLAALIKVPLVVLVNQQTQTNVWRWAAELRAKQAGVLIGSSNPQVHLAPDISLAVRLEDERTFQRNPFAELTSGPLTNLSATNSLLTLVDHTSEADLVRQRVKDGEEDGVSTPRPVAPKVIRDPALARALDLLKALAVLKPVRG